MDDCVLRFWEVIQVGATHSIEKDIQLTVTFVGQYDGMLVYSFKLLKELATADELPFHNILRWSRQGYHPSDLWRAFRARRS